MNWLGEAIIIIIIINIYASTYHTYTVQWILNVCVPCTLYCVPCTVYCLPCTVYCVLCTVYCVLCTVYRLIYNSVLQILLQVKFSSLFAKNYNCCIVIIIIISSSGWLSRTPSRWTRCPTRAAAPALRQESTRHHPDLTIKKHHPDY